MAKALIFMPFDPNHSSIQRCRSEYANDGKYEKNKKVKEFLVKKGYSVMIEWYSGKKLPYLQSLDTGAIYIRGHGIAGDHSIISSSQLGEEVSYDTVFERLLESGLKQTFQGHIHCYNCHSAEPGKKGFSKVPYARMFADHMFSRGYKSCKFYGYLGPLDSFPKDGSKGKDIYSRDPYADKGKQEYGTWDEARVSFKPTVNNYTLTGTVNAAAPLIKANDPLKSIKVLNV